MGTRVKQTLYISINTRERQLTHIILYSNILSNSRNIFGPALGDDERNNGSVKERNDPGNNRGTHFGTSPLIVTKVANGVQPVKIAN